jgi:D-glycero-alpha-D-manno-heptose-7-phosphate kinase
MLFVRNCQVRIAITTRKAIEPPDSGMAFAGASCRSPYLDCPFSTVAKLLGHISVPVHGLLRFVTMIITRTPLRISIGGGGTDLPSYYRAHEHGATVLSAAIDKYIYIGINKTFVSDYFIKYSELERVQSVTDIAHPIVREALLAVPVGPGIEIVSLADIPSGTGLGSSGAFTVGLLRALFAFRREHVSAAALAELACHIEIDRLGQPVGKQDQYIAAYGGITRFRFNQDDTVDATPVAVSPLSLFDLEEHLLLFFTGYSRSAGSILADQKEKLGGNDLEMATSMEHTRRLGQEIDLALEQGDTRRFGRLMHEHWEFKRKRSGGMSNPQIDGWYELGRANGVLGGKLVGAGAGGFLMFYAEEPARLRRVMAEAGLEEVRFRFDQDGSTVLSRG